ncbi:MAG: polyphosphate kinase 1 [Deltaproteobacteria bacterium]|nr:polyphosphate kinase 1 [Deltaproteobacteria bacterium]
MDPKEKRNKKIEKGDIQVVTADSAAGKLSAGKGKTVVVKSEKLNPDPADILINREISWLIFARRVLALAENPDLPLLERVKFVGIMGMLYDEFSMKRIGALKGRTKKKKLSHLGLTPTEELQMCQDELQKQAVIVSRLVRDELRPALEKAGIPILEYKALNKKQRANMKQYFRKSVEPILTPLAVDVSHPFPFISNLGLNLAVTVKENNKKNTRFVRIKVPANRPRWVPLSEGTGYVPLEQVIACNLRGYFPRASRVKSYFFRVSRGAKDDPWEKTVLDDQDEDITPGSLIGTVTNELTGRKFAGVVRLQVSSSMPKKLQRWLAKQLQADIKDIEPTDGLLGLSDLAKFQVERYTELRDPPHEPVTHPRLRLLNPGETEEIFAKIRRGDILLHHPYHSFDSSTLRFIQCAAVDPRVLAIKITIYRTSSQSPIINALVEAARNGKQVAVLVEITARFDEAPNIAWGKLLEREGVHVAYGVERLKTHVKLALVVREEEDGIRRYVHVGTGNYHTGTARIYEDLGILSCDPELGTNVATLFNELTGAIGSQKYTKLMVAPHNLLDRFIELIRREVRHRKEGRPSGIRAKMNQLQDDRIIGELYKASQAGVPISLNVRGMCCLRARVPGLSDNISVFSTLGRFLEHGRIYRFENGGDPEFFIGSADWMRRNLDRRMESIMPVEDPRIKDELEEILRVYENDNCSAWDMCPDGSYVLRQPDENEEPRSPQKVFIDLAGR